MKSVIVLTAASALLAGCASYQPTNQEVGAVSGAVVGGLVGSQFGGGAGRVLTTLGGAAVGGVVGSEIGKNVQ